MQPEIQVGKSHPWATGTTRAYPGYCSVKQLEELLLPLEQKIASQLQGYSKQYFQGPFKHLGDGGGGRGITWSVLCPRKKYVELDCEYSILSCLCKIRELAKKIHTCIVQDQEHGCFDSCCAPLGFDSTSVLCPPWYFMQSMMNLQGLNPDLVIWSPSYPTTPPALASRKFYTWSPRYFLFQSAERIINWRCDRWK